MPAQGNAFYGAAFPDGHYRGAECAFEQDPQGRGTRYLPRAIPRFKRPDKHTLYTHIRTPVECTRAFDYLVSDLLVHCRLPPLETVGYIVDRLRALSLDLQKLPELCETSDYYVSASLGLLLPLYCSSITAEVLRSGFKLETKHDIWEVFSKRLSEAEMALERGRGSFADRPSQGGGRGQTIQIGQTESPGLHHAELPIESVRALYGLISYAIQRTAVFPEEFWGSVGFGGDLAASFSAADLSVREILAEIPTTDPASLGALIRRLYLGRHGAACASLDGGEESVRPSAVSAAPDASGAPSAAEIGQSEEPRESACSERPGGTDNTRGLGDSMLPASPAPSVPLISKALAVLLLPSLGEARLEALRTAALTLTTPRTGLSGGRLCALLGLPLSFSRQLLGILNAAIDTYNEVAQKKKETRFLSRIVLRASSAAKFPEHTAAQDARGDGESEPSGPGRPLGGSEWCLDNTSFSLFQKPFLCKLLAPCLMSLDYLHLLGYGGGAEGAMDFRKDMASVIFALRPADFGRPWDVPRGISWKYQVYAGEDQAGGRVDGAGSRPRAANAREPAAPFVRPESPKAPAEEPPRKRSAVAGFNIDVGGLEAASSPLDWLSDQLLLPSDIGEVVLSTQSGASRLPGEGDGRDRHGATDAGEAAEAAGDSKKSAGGGADAPHSAQSENRAAEGVGAPREPSKGFSATPQHGISTISDLPESADQAAASGISTRFGAAADANPEGWRPGGPLTSISNPPALSADPAPFAYSADTNTQDNPPSAGMSCLAAVTQTPAEVEWALSLFSSLHGGEAGSSKPYAAPIPPLAPEDLASIRTQLRQEFGIGWLWGAAKQLADSATRECDSECASLEQQLREEQRQCEALEAGLRTSLGKADRLRLEIAETEKRIASLRENAPQHIAEPILALAGPLDLSQIATPTLGLGTAPPPRADLQLPRKDQGDQPRAAPSKGKLVSKALVLQIYEIEICRVAGERLSRLLLKQAFRAWAWLLARQQSLRRSLRQIRGMQYAERVRREEQLEEARLALAEREARAKALLLTRAKASTTDRQNPGQGSGFGGSQTAAEAGGTRRDSAERERSQAELGRALALLAEI